VIRFGKGDVAIIRNVRLCVDCGDETQKEATHVVMLDFRGAGSQVPAGDGEYCHDCATEFAERIRETLPECEGED